MALEDIKKAILDEANKTIKEIEKNGEEKIAQINAEWNDKLKERREQILAIAQRKADQKIQQTQFKLQAQTKMEILTRKQKIIDKVFDSAVKKLQALDNNQYVELMTNLIAYPTSDEGKLVSAQNKEPLLKKALHKSGKNYELLAETLKTSGGFFFRSKNVDMDFTFAALVSNAKEKTTLEINRVLFNQNQN